MNEKEKLRHESASPFIFAGWLLKALPWGAAGAAIGLLLAWGSISVVPAKYEALVLIAVGQVGQASQVVGQANQVVGQPIEPVAQAVERVKSPAFQSRVAEAIGDGEWVGRLKGDSAGGARELSVKVVRSSPVIELKVRAESPGHAGKIAAAVVDELKQIHADLAKPALVRLQSELAKSKERLVAAEKERDDIVKLITATGIQGDRSVQLALATTLRVLKDEISSIRETVAALEERLSEPATQSTKTIEPVFLSNMPVSPKKRLLLTLGLIGGLFAGLIAAVVRGGCIRGRLQHEAGRE